jgi:polygalacturonase
VSLLPQGRASPQAPRIFDPKHFGALGDGQALDTPALQRAIDAASHAGGGTVQLPPGRYVTGTLLLKSNVTLELLNGATLLGSLNPAHYQLVEPFTDGVGTIRGYALIACIDAHKIAIIGPTTAASAESGPAVIDGRGADLHAAAPDSPAAKPFLFLSVRSTNLTLRNLTLHNSAAWTMHLFQSSNVTVGNLSIRSLGLANNDGIANCTIETGDDAICLKTTSPTPCRDIAIERCTLTTRCAAFKIGTETVGNLSNIRVRDCHVIQANLGAIKILSVDGAHISNVLVENIHVDDADTPIFLRLGARGRTFRPGDTALPPGSISGIAIRNLTAQHARRIGILISGIPNRTIDHVTLKAISIAMTGEIPTTVPPEPEEKPDAYPEVRMFGPDLASYGLYARHIRGLTLKAVHITPITGDPRPESFLSDSSDSPSSH